MAKSKTVVAKNALELTKVLGLKAADAYEWEVQANLLTKLREVVTKSKLTHEQVAKKAGTSRTRITSILNANLDHVSTDLLIRILGSLGYEVNVSVSRAKIAA
jgi:predicted XRE-type DNA-binding protein